MNSYETQTDQLLCRCLAVKESEVRECVSMLGASSVKDVTRLCGAGGGCMVCHRRIRSMLSEGQSKSAAAYNDSPALVSG